MTICSTDRHRIARPVPNGWAACALTLVLLTGLAVDRLFVRAPSSDSAAYHDRVKSAATAVPLLVGRWVGTDVEVASAAVALLKPNVILSRNYTEIGSGRHFNLLVVQCKDARDILGHYPPVCYRGRGYAEDDRTPVDRDVNGLAVAGMRYVFTTTQHTRMTVENFMVLPNGTTARDMDAVELAAQDLRQKYFGAAQVQLVFDEQTSDADREEIFRTFVGMLRPLLGEVMRKPAGDEGKARI